MLCCRVLFRTETASWRASYRRVWVVMHARRWSFAVLRRHSMKLKPNQHCFLDKGMLYFVIAHWLVRWLLKVLFYMAVMSKQVVLYEINDWFLIDGVTVFLVVYRLCMSLCVSCWCTSAKCLNAWSWVFCFRVANCSNGQLLGIKRGLDLIVQNSSKTTKVWICLC